jgi:hypothetical protein
MANLIKNRDNDAPGFVFPHKIEIKHPKINDLYFKE